MIRNLKTLEQKKDWFLRLDPNGPFSSPFSFLPQKLFSSISTGRIPILIDSNQTSPFPVMESSAELVYLQATYDTKHEFGFTDPLEWSQALQWLFFWHGSGAPYIGQYAHFVRMAEEKIPCTLLFRYPCFDRLEEHRD